jgi:ABC-type multidrug transport system permease subunit
MHLVPLFFGEIYNKRVILQARYIQTDIFMDMSTTELGLLILATMIIIGIISYFIGVRKTDSPYKASALGFVFSIIPVLGIIYVIYLIFKEDLNRAT